MPLPLALSLMALAAIGWFLKSDLREYRVFQRLSAGEPRRARYRLWLAKAALAFMVPALIGLALTARLSALIVFPHEFDPLRMVVPDYRGELPMFLGSVIGGAGIGMAAVALVTRLRPSGRPIGTFGRIGALLPQSRAELRYGVLLAIAAGVFEEVFFRLFVPLMVTLATGRAIVGFVAAGLLFGAVHLYQGWKGVLATTVFGAALAVTYIGTGALWVAVLLHVALDLNGLVFRPLVNGVWRVQPSR